jgi:RNA polymerase sigma-70 factor (ECF subfamily)
MNGYGLQQGSGRMSRQAIHSGPQPKHAAFPPRPRPDATAAFEALFHRYHGKVYAIAMSLLMDQRESEKVTRKVFLAVMRKPDHFHDALALSWRIYRICVNACLVRLRKNRRTKAVPIEEFLPVFTGEGAHPGPVEDWSREAERRFPEKDPGRAIGRFAEELPDSYRVVFALCDVHGFSCEESAQVLHLMTETVKGRLHRARLCLRERLGRYLQGD